MTTSPRRRVLTYVQACGAAASDGKHCNHEVMLLMRGVVGTKNRPPFCRLRRRRSCSTRPLSAGRSGQMLLRSSRLLMFSFRNYLSRFAS